MPGPWAYPQVNRFSAGCTLGFDGYCIGEPIGDFRAPLGEGQWPDQRWLILHRRDELVASGRVQSQSKESRLGSEPGKRCTHRGGLPLPKVGKLTVTPPGKGQSLANLQVESTGAVVVGYAIHLIAAPVDGTYPYDRIGAKSNAPSFSAEWNHALAAQHLPDQSGELQVAAVACLAAANPHGPPAVVRVRLSHGQIADIHPDTAIDAATQERLSYIACSVPS